MSLDKFTFYVIGLFIGFCDICVLIGSVLALIAGGIAAIPIIVILFVVFLVLTTTWIDYYNDKDFMDFFNRK